jgi:hypothetical protein
MDPARDDLSELRSIVFRLRAQRAELDPLRSDQLKQRVLARSHRKQRLGGLVKSRIATVVTLAALAGGTGGALAVASSDPSGNAQPSAAKGQYRPGKRCRHECPKPTNKFTVSHIQTHPDGNVQFNLTVPDAGQLDVLETNWEPSSPGIQHTVLLHPGPHRYAFARRHLNLARAGTVRITVRPSALAVYQVRHHHRSVRINLWITYQPIGGAPATSAFLDLFVTN